MMKQLPSLTKIPATVASADSRKATDELAGLCKASGGRDPFAGSVFDFRNQRGTAIKAPAYAGQGFWHCHKRLSEGAAEFRRI